MTRIAMAQMLVTPGELDANLDRAVHLIGEAARQGCEMVVLPECLDLGWTYPFAAELAQPISGPCSDRLAKAAAKHGIYVAAGLTERNGELVHNAAVLISPAGDILLKHRKIHELDIATHLYTAGSSLGAVETGLGKIGLNICADNSPDALPLGHALGCMGAELLVSPSAWAVPPGHDNAAEPYGGMWREAYRELAKAHCMPIVGVSNVGRIVGGAWDGWNCIGCSLAVDTNGDVLVQGPYGASAEALLVVDVPMGRFESKV